MKKVFLSLAVVFSVALVSCGGKKAAEEAEQAAPAEVEVVEAEVVTDSAAVDSPATDSAAPAAEETPAQ